MPPNDPLSNPGQLDMSLSLMGGEEMRELVKTIETLSDSVMTAHSFAADLRNAAEQGLATGFGAEHRTPAEARTPQAAQMQLGEAAGRAASTGAESAVEAQRAYSEARGAAASTGTEAPSEENIANMGASAGASYDPERIYPSEEQQILEDIGGMRKSPTPPDPGFARRSLGAMGRGARATGRGIIHPWTGAVDPLLATLMPNEGYASGAVDPAQAQTDQDTGQRTGGGGASRPPASVAEGDPAWWRSMHAHGMQPIQMPRIGDFQTQDVLQMAARPFERLAASRYGAAREEALAAGKPIEEADVGAFTAGAGRVAATLGQAAAFSPYVSHFGGEYLGTSGAPGFMGLQMNPQVAIAQAQTAGQDLQGAQTWQDVPGLAQVSEATGFNFNLPAPVRLATDFIAGGTGDDSVIGRQLQSVREGGRYAGVDKDEIAMLRDRMATTGRESQGDRMQYMQTAFRLMSNEGARGVDTGIINEALEQGTQYNVGAQNLKELADEIERIPESAKAARIGLDEMGTQMIAMGNFFQEQLGGTFRQGARAAGDWAAQTGMAPSVGQQLMTNPLVQGTISGNTGLLPQTQGVLPQGARTTGILDTMEMLMGTFKGSQRGGLVDVPGVGKTRVGGEQAELALVAEQLGISPEAAQALWNRRGQARATGNLQTAADMFRAQLRGAPPGSQARERMMRMGRNPNDQIATVPEMLDTAKKAGMGRERRQELRQQFKEDPRAALRNIEKFAAKKGKSMQDLTQKEQVDVAIEFKGAAAKFFKEFDKKDNSRDQNKKEANAGRGPGNKKYRNPDAPASVHPLTAAAESVAGGKVRSGMRQYSGEQGWGELADDIGERAEDVGNFLNPFG